MIEIELALVCGFSLGILVGIKSGRHEFNTMAELTKAALDNNDDLITELRTQIAKEIDA